MTDGIFSIRGHEFYGDGGGGEFHSMLVVQCEGKESKVGLVEKEEREGWIEGEEEGERKE